MKQARLMKALADETRLRVMNLLLTAKVPLCVCEMVDALNLPQYLVSRHLVILKNVELVKVEKKGTWAYHSLENEGGANATVIVFLRAFLAGERFEQDRTQLEKRLRLRKAGKCVVGFPLAEKPFRNRLEGRPMPAKVRV